MANNSSHSQLSDIDGNPIPFAIAQLVNGVVIATLNIMLIHAIWCTKQQRMPSRVEGMMIVLSACDLLVGIGCAPGNAILLYNKEWVHKILDST